MTITMENSRQATLEEYGFVFEEYNEMERVF
jgi:hypothetical protein